MALKQKIITRYGVLDIPLMVLPRLTDGTDRCSLHGFPKNSVHDQFFQKNPANSVEANGIEMSIQCLVEQSVKNEENSDPGYGFLMLQKNAD